MDQQLNIFGYFLFNLNDYFLFIPVFLFIFGFLETFGIVGYLLPAEIILATTFAYISIDIRLFYIGVIMFFLGIFMGGICGYFFSFFYYKNFIDFFKNKFSFINKSMIQIDKIFHKYNFFSFIIIMNVGIIRPLMSVYLGHRKYDFKKYFSGIFLASFTYVVSRAFLGYLIGIFGKIVLNYFEIGYEYLFMALVIFILIFIVIKLLRARKKIQSRDGIEF